MAIGNVTLNSSISTTAPNAVSATANESKNLENELMHKQQRLKDLSSDSEMTAAEKAKKQQEIQKQIAELNRKLELKRMEEQEEAQKAAKEEAQKAASKEEQLEEIASTDQKKEESSKEYEKKMEELKTSAADMQQFIKNDLLLQQARIQENVIQKNSQTGNILESEIKSDTFYGSDTQAKEEELAKLRQVEDYKIKEKEPRQVKQDPLGIHPDAKIVIRE